MDPIFIIVAIAIFGAVCFAVGFFVAQHNAKQAATIVGAINGAKDAITAHTTATAAVAAAAPKPPAAS